MLKRSVCQELDAIIGERQRPQLTQTRRRTVALKSELLIIHDRSGNRKLEKNRRSTSKTYGNKANKKVRREGVATNVAKLTQTGKRPRVDEQKSI